MCEENVLVDGLNEQVIDIIDESDAILDHNFQLVYALGSQIPLPDGECRWVVVEAFLRLLARGDCKAISAILSDPSLVHKESNDHGSFPKLRFLVPFKEKGYEEIVGPAMCRQIVESPPHELSWMRYVAEEDVPRLVSIMSDPKLCDAENLIQSSLLFREHRGYILAARGCIAYGLLFHGLSSRNQVNYGLNEVSTSKIKMAVPFSACDTPKPRTEYSHPDMAIVYTCLSYFNKGLTESQFKESLLLLQKTGPTAQNSIYGEWIESAKDDVLPDELTKFDNILKVDVGNKLQFDIMYHHLHRCMEVISFWMNNFVFPTETYQFPARRSSSAWNLVDSGTAVGFSGTDDNRDLLPLDIKQIKPAEKQLCATNGSMIELILECSREEISLLADAATHVSLWESVLSRCIALGMHDLIDVAGLMAGSRNEQVARFYAENLCDENEVRSTVNDFRGVVYFDTKSNVWMVYEIENKRDLPLKSSSFTESECFVYFDESRCRGSDMKLSNQASALVTLEPKLTKDKFLQACARMRKLRPGGQSLTLAGTSEAVSVDSTPKDVLEKILRSTVRSTLKGVLTFHEKGRVYESFPDPIKDDYSLGAMYGSAVSEYLDICDYLDKTHESEELSERGNRLVEHCKGIGRGVTMRASQFTEECERELECEVEQEEEEEVEFARQQPYAQEDWSYEQAFLDPESLFDVLFQPVERFICDRLGDLSKIHWSTKLFCTPNFWKTIQQSESRDLSLYLRPVSSVLVMPDGRVVLLSLYEADNLLPYWWRVQSPKAILQQLCTVTSGRGFGKDTVEVPIEVLTSAKLFAGCVQYTESERKVVRSMIRTTESHDAVHDLIFMRGMRRFFERSHLEEIMFSIMCEGSQ